MNFFESDFEEKREKIYVFKVSLNHKPWRKVYRELAVRGSTDLYTFAGTILKAFNFQLDHAFGFYSNIRAYSDSLEVYTSFKAEGCPIEAREKSVKTALIYKVFEPAKKMLFIFDYGDNWEFLVDCKRLTHYRRFMDDDEIEGTGQYPKIIKIQGEAPKQYPGNSEDEFAEEEEEAEGEENEIL